MRLRWFSTAALLFCLTPAVQAASSASSSPSDFVTVGGTAYFSADDGGAGRELWRTDGTAAGTYRLTDACPGPCSAFPSFYAFSDRSYYFLARDETGRFNLWVTDGAAGSTLRLTSGPVQVAPDGNFQRRWVASLGLLFFLADDGVHGPELWRSDGTPAGTYQVTDLRSGPEGSSPRELTAFNGRLYFVADDGVRGPILWKSDGTPGGTVPVRDPVPSSAAHDGPSQLRAVGGWLFFVAPTPNQGVELWRSNGTTRGTAPLADLAPGAASTTFYAFTFLGNHLYFVADAGLGQELWTSDGTPSGTRVLTVFAAPYAFYSPANDSPYLPLETFGDRFAFVADDGVHGFEIWRTDGTPQGTSLVKDVCPGSCSGAQYLQPFGERLVFPGTTPARGQEPWISDGTAGGTHLVRDLCKGACSSSLFYFAWDLGGRMVFAARQPEGSRLWSSDGTPRGTAPLSTFLGVGGVPGIGITSLGNRLVFAGQDAEHGIELWATDGTPQGTVLLADIR